MSKAAFVNREPARREVIHKVPTDSGGAERFGAANVRFAVNEALAGCPLAGIEIVSAVPEWVELRVPCDPGVISLLQELLTKLDADLPQQMGEAISYAFREMLSNALEYGGRPDPAARVEIRFLRLKRA